MFPGRRSHIDLVVFFSFTSVLQKTGDRAQLVRLFVPAKKTPPTAATVKIGKALGSPQTGALPSVDAVPCPEAKDCTL